MTQADADELVAQVREVIADATRYKAERDKLLSAALEWIDADQSGRNGVRTAKAYIELINVVSRVQIANRGERVPIMERSEVYDDDHHP